jgi:GPI mannosyltransferase 2
MVLFHKGYRFIPALIWSVAGTVRSNALLWAGFFAWDTMNVIATDPWNILKTGRHVMYLGFCACVSVGGFVWWQYSAWNQYCSSLPHEEWCSTSIPLIYFHVQRKYWYIPHRVTPINIIGMLDFYDIGQ